MQNLGVSPFPLRHDPRETEPSVLGSNFTSHAVDVRIAPSFFMLSVICSPELFSFHFHFDVVSHNHIFCLFVVFLFFSHVVPPDTVPPVAV